MTWQDVATVTDHFWFEWTSYQREVQGQLEPNCEHGGQIRAHVVRIAGRNKLSRVVLFLLEMRTT